MSFYTNKSPPAGSSSPSDHHKPSAKDVLSPKSTTQSQGQKTKGQENKVKEGGRNPQASAQEMFGLDKKKLAKSKPKKRIKDDK